MCSKMNWNPKMNPFQKAFEKITEIIEPSFWKDNFSSKEIQNTGFFHKISRTPQQQQRCIGTEEFRSLFWNLNDEPCWAESYFPLILSCNHRELDRTNPTDGDICKIFYKEERKKQQRPFILLYFEIRIFQGHFPPPNKAALLGAIGCSHLLR